MAYELASLDNLKKKKRKEEGFWPTTGSYVLTALEMFLMFKYARLGPSSLHTGRYSNEIDHTDHEDSLA